MAIWTILVLSAAVVGAAPTMRLRGGSTGKLSLETMISAANDPEAIAELKALMQDPEALAEARQLMDDPEFRAQVQEALSEGGADGLQRLQSQLGSSGDDNDLSSGLRALGPSLGAALDLLKSDVTADEFKAACGVLSSLVQRRLKEGAERVGAEGPRLRLANDKLQERLLRHTHGRRCLTALGFTEEVEGDEEDEEDARRGAMLEVGETVVLDAPQLTRARAVIDEALADSSRASEISAAHGLPYKLALELPTVRRACQGEESLGQQVTALFLEHAEFRAMVCTPELSEQALPSILPLLRSRDGLLALIEFFTGAGPPEGTKVTSVSTLRVEGRARRGGRPARRRLLLQHRPPRLPCARPDVLAAPRSQRGRVCRLVRLHPRPGRRAHRRRPRTAGLCGGGRARDAGAHLCLFCRLPRAPQVADVRQLRRG